MSKYSGAKILQRSSLLTQVELNGTEFWVRNEELNAPQKSEPEPKKRKKLSLATRTKMPISARRRWSYEGRESELAV